MKIQPFFNSFGIQGICFVSSAFGRLMTWSVFLATVLIAFNCAAKDVQLTDMSLEELMDIRIKPVVSASKYEQKSMDAPSSMTVITAEEIARYGYRTLGDLLQSIRGFHITNDRNYSYVGFRGFNRPGDYSSRVLLLLDGVRINDNIFGSAALGADFILDLDLIQRVEVVRGPSYALYGNSAFFVVVNVITRDAEDVQGLEASGDAGSFDAYKGRVSYGDVLSNAGSLVVSGSILDSQGQNLYFQEFDTPDHNNGFAEGGDEESAGNLFLKYAQGDLTIESAYVKRSKQIPTGSWGMTFNDPRNKSWDERAFLDLKMEHRVNQRLDIMARLTYSLYTYEGKYAFFDEETLEPYINRDDSKGQWWGADFHMVHKLGRHTLLSGGEYRDNFTLYQKNFDEFGPVYLNDRQNTRNWGLFLQDEFAVLSSLKLNAGLRYDHFSTFGNTVNPRVALIYRPMQETAFKYIAGKAFRAPNAYELFYNDGGTTQKAGTELDCERIISHDLIWEQMLGDYYTTALSLYYYKVEDLISLVTDADDDLLTFINRDEVKARGIEGEITGLFPNGFKGSFSYAYQESDFTQSGLIWTNSPRHLAKLNLSMPILKEGFYLSIEEQYTSSLDTLTGNTAGDYFLTHLTLYAREMIKNLDFSASLYNLFDEHYSFPGSDEHIQDSIPQDGRSCRIKLTLKF